MPITVLIPVNRLDRAKGRLEGILSPAERRLLAAATLRTVHAAAVGAGANAIVLTADRSVAEILPPGSQVLGESPNASGLNGQLEQAIGRLRTRELLILHADLPLASAGALEALLGAAKPAPSVTLVESTDGGTNAMLLRPPGRFPLAYGKGSAALHRAAAARAALAAVTVTRSTLALDLDTPADIAAFMATDGWQETLAGAVLNPIRERLAASFERPVVADERDL